MRKLTSFLCLTGFIFCASAGLAQVSNLRIEKNSPLKIEYKFIGWNKNSLSRDTAAIIIRDAMSGKLVKMNLQETEDDSSFFVGSFGIGFEGSEIQPEVYVVPQKMLNEKEKLMTVAKLINDGSILRKPFFIRKEGSVQKLTVYDTAEQALEAYNNFRKNYKGKDIVDPNLLEAQRKAALLAEQARLVEAAKLQEAQRLAMEAAEKLKQQELIKKQLELTEAEKAKRKAEAKSLADQALKAYTAEKYADAESLFAKAVEFDPENKEFYFQYGVTLYRTEKFNKSIVILNSSAGASVNPLDKGYFLALNYVKLKEYDQAIKQFEVVKQGDNKTLSSSSAFYIGILEFQNEKYESSKSNFEFVLDNSTDSNLDQQAESYIEQIANIMAFEAEKKKRFILTANMGMMFDSNILSVANSNLTEGSATGLEGYRAMYGGSIEYRPIYNIKHEFSAILSASDMYSMSPSFQAKTEFQNTDPLSMSIAFPYKYKETLFGKPWQMVATPSYETINMNSDKEGSRELLVSSVVTKLDNTLVMNENYFAAYGLEYRSDTPTSGTGTDDDQTAKKISLSTSHTFFTDKKKTTAWIGDMTLASNQAEGANQTYFRYDLGGTYLAPWIWETSYTARLSLGQADYSKHLIGRKDTVYGLNLGLTKPLSETWTAALAAAYTINQSTLESSDYKKYTIMAVFTWSQGY